MIISPAGQLLANTETTFGLVGNVQRFDERIGRGYHVEAGGDQGEAATTPPSVPKFRLEALASRVMALEYETWRNPDAVEDTGSAAPISSGTSTGDVGMPADGADGPASGAMPTQ